MGTFLPDRAVLAGDCITWVAKTIQTILSTCTAFFLFFIVFSYLLVNYRAHLLAVLCCCVCISLAASGCILVIENLFTTMTIAALDQIIINFLWLLVPCPKSFDLDMEGFGSAFRIKNNLKAYLSMSEWSNRWICMIFHTSSHIFKVVLALTSRRSLSTSDFSMISWALQDKAVSVKATNVHNNLLCIFFIFLILNSFSLFFRPKEMKR